MVKKICIVTGTRAEWGLLSNVAKGIHSEPGLSLQIIATNMHLSSKYGFTYQEIIENGFNISYRVEMNVDEDDDVSIVKSMGLAMTGFAKAYDFLKPDMVVVLGDRYEILVAVSAALIFKIPVAHLYGGDITEGAFDDAIRHAITKMSHLHFTSTERYRERVIQMGEDPTRVFNVGATGVENIKKMTLWSKEETERSLDGFILDGQTVLVTFHPVTLEHHTSQCHIQELLSAFDQMLGVRVIFTMPNSDAGNLIIAERIKNWCELNTHRSICFTSLGLKRYLSVLQYIGAVAGNSSSGIFEAPSFGVPTLNIGNRQKGRIAADSVVNCEPLALQIVDKLTAILSQARKIVVNPYEQPNTSERIVEEIRKASCEHLLLKKFHNINAI